MRKVNVHAAKYMHSLLTQVMAGIFALQLESVLVTYHK